MRARGLILLTMILIALAIPPRAAAQAAERCFAETGYCVSGRVREVWERSGGLMVFGYPITPLQQETIEGRTLTVQWFERGRLELHPSLPRPYDVQLGRLGVELLRTPRPVAPARQPDGECRRFAETGRSACGPFLDAWRASGLELDGRPGASDAERMALFGLPLTDPQVETLRDGRQYTVQWFERGRFELHPQGVQFGLLGREASPVARTPVRLAPQVARPPARLVVPKIGLDTRVVATGLDRSGAPIVLDHDVSWFNQSARPGEGENIALWGHVLRFRHARNIPAPFARMKELAVGDTVTLYDDQGRAHAYAVTRRVLAKPDEVQYILPQGREMVTMVSCYGDRVVSGGEVVDMTQRLIVIAEPVR